MADLRIGIVIDSFTGSRNGVVVATRRLVAALRRRHRVVVITGGAEADGPDQVRLPELRLPLLHRLIADNGLQLAWPARVRLTQALREVDVVQIQMPYVLGMAALRTANRLGVPTIVAYHVQAENWLYQAGVRSPRVIDAVSRWFVRSFYDRAQLVVCLNPFGAQTLRRYGLRAPVELVSNGLPDEYRPAPDPRPPGSAFTVLTVGRLAVEKQHELIIEAVGRSRHARRIQLHIVGDGKLRQRLQTLGARLPRPARIGPVGDGELLQLYRAADLYVHASLVELESLSTLEAMGCGLPVLLADAPHSAATHFALDGRSLFSANSAADLAVRLDYWIENTDDLALAGRRYAELADRYRLGASVERMEAIYRSLRGRIRAP